MKVVDTLEFTLPSYSVGGFLFVFIMGVGQFPELRITAANQINTNFKPTLEDFDICSRSSNLQKRKKKKKFSKLNGFVV